MRDEAGVLSDETERRLAAELSEIERNLGPQAAVVTVKSLHGYAIADFSLAYANAWGLGHRGRDDGILVLLAPNERDVRIEVGKGLEGTLTNAFCAQVIEQDMLPALKRGTYDVGLFAAVEALRARIARKAADPTNDNGKHTEIRKDAA